MGARSITTAELRAECTTLERAVLSARLTTKDVLAAHRPGGSGNSGKDAPAWLAYYRHLHRTHAKGEPSGDSTAPAALTVPADAEPVVLDALRSAPAVVELVGSVAPDGGDLVLVHPKAFIPLQAFRRRDARVDWLTEQRAQLLSLGPAAADDDLLRRVDEELAYQYALLVWGATTEGCGLPYEEHDAPEDVPTWLLALDPVDVLRIREAFVQVNALRLAALSALLAAQTAADRAADAPPGQQRPQWSTFFATRADEQHTAGGAAALMRDRALAAVLAESIVASSERARVAREAEARAKAAAESREGRS